MSNDISNNYIHNIINDRIQDLSANQSNQFMNYLVNLINDTNINSNLAMLPIANNFIQSNNIETQRVNQVLHNSLLEKTPYKKVLSKKGRDELKIVKYNKDLYNQESCCITFEKFKENDEVILLPCNHIFDISGINEWFNESSKCPVCRYELDFEEIKDENVNQNIEQNIQNMQNITYNNNYNYNQMFNTMDFLYNPIETINRPIRRQLISQNSFLNQFMDVENTNFQNSLITSVFDSITNDSSDSDNDNDFSGIFNNLIDNNLIDNNLIDNNLIDNPISDDDDDFYI